MLRARILLIAMTATLASCAQNQPHKPTDDGKTPAAAPAAHVNPLLTRSPLQYQAPPFDKITDADYQPAIEQGMKEQIVEIEQIANNADAPTFANTIEAMERSGATFTRATKVFFAITQANTNDTLQKAQEDLAPKIAAHQDAITLNPKLFARVQAVYDARAKLEPEQKNVAEHYYRNFVRAGAKLKAADQDKLKELNKEESALSTAFGSKLLAATKDGALVVDSKDALDGFSESDLAAAEQAGKDRKLDGKFVVPLQNTTQQPAQVSLTNRGTREKLFEASINRAEHNDANDTRATIQRLAQLRAEKAKLLGFKNYASYSLDDQMAKTPAHAIKLMTDMVPAAINKAKGEAAQMQKLVDKQKGGFKLAPWDWQFYSEQVKKAQYAIDENEVKQYFVLDRVLQDGVFFAANKLYGLTFKERHDIPVYQPDVRVFEVFDKDGTSMALFYADYFKRDNKAGGAWEDSFVQQSGMLGNHPVAFNVCNFTKPAPGQPALISHDDVIAMFHEFGHALHEMLSNVKYPLVAGTSTTRDFVEFPSQFNEHWADEPTVFANFAKHYKTGEPMPKELIAKIKKAGTYGQGFDNTEFLAAALLDQAWHELPPNAPKQDVDKFEADALKKFRVDYALIPPRYRSSYFAHIWGGGYSAGYYAYLWSAVLRDDAFYWFKEHGGMTRENGQRFRDMILSRGYTEDLDVAYRKWRGRDPSVEPLLIERGLKPGKSHK